MDNSKMVNFLNFKNIGADTVQPSESFKKIRAYSRVYNTNLIHHADNLTTKYNQLNNLYLTDNMFLDSINYGNVRQHNLTSSSATTAVNASLLDQRSMNKFIDYTMGYRSDA
jgi:hypothetical protein